MRIHVKGRPVSPKNTTHDATLDDDERRQREMMPVKGPWLRNSTLHSQAPHGDILSLLLNFLSSPNRYSPVLFFLCWATSTRLPRLWPSSR